MKSFEYVILILPEDYKESKQKNDEFDIQSLTKLISTIYSSYLLRFDLKFIEQNNIFDGFRNFRELLLIKKN